MHRENHREDQRFAAEIVFSALFVDLGEIVTTDTTPSGRTKNPIQTLLPRVVFQNHGAVYNGYQDLQWCTDTGNQGCCSTLCPGMIQVDISGSWTSSRYLWMLVRHNARCTLQGKWLLCTVCAAVTCCGSSGARDGLGWTARINQIPVRWRTVPSKTAQWQQPRQRSGNTEE